MGKILADLSLTANLLMGLGFLIWLAGEIIGIKIHTDKKDTTTEWLRAFRVKCGRTALAAGLSLVWITLLIHTETSWP